MTLKPSNRLSPLPFHKGMCLAKSSTSNRLERIAYRELVLERLRLVPKAHWILGRRGDDFVAGTARCAVRTLYLPGEWPFADAAAQRPYHGMLA